MSFRNRTLTDALAASVPAGEQPGRGRFRPASPAETRSRRRGGPRPGDADDIRSRGRCSRIGRRPACAAALQPANLAQCLNSQRQRGFNAMRVGRPASKTLDLRIASLAAASAGACKAMHNPGSAVARFLVLFGDQLQGPRPEPRQPATLRKPPRRPR